MTYAFIIPDDAKIIGIYFYETFGTTQGSPAIFTLDPNYTLLRLTRQQHR